MATDWIKMRTDLAIDPKVLVMAERLLSEEFPLSQASRLSRDCHVTRHAMRHAVVGSLVTVWGVVRQRGRRAEENLTVAKATLATIDDIVGMPGFGRAMEFVGWVASDRNGLVFPSFFTEYNSEPPKTEAKSDAERSREYRARKKAQDSKNDSVTSVTKRHVTSRQRREEKSIEDKQAVEDGLAHPPTADEADREIEELISPISISEPKVATRPPEPQSGSWMLTPMEMNQEQEFMRTAGVFMDAWQKAPSGKRGVVHVACIGETGKAILAHMSAIEKTALREFLPLRLDAALLALRNLEAGAIRWNRPAIEITKFPQAINVLCGGGQDEFTQPRRRQKEEDRVEYIEQEHMKVINWIEDESNQERAAIETQSRRIS